MWYPKIKTFIDTLSAGSIPRERNIILQPLIDFIQLKHQNKQDINLTFICTHNSRRSHLTQVWAQVMASYFNIEQVFCYSGGTEATAVFPMVIETLRDTGFKVDTVSEGKNPKYTLRFSENEPPVVGFSKTYDDVFNPQSGFAAVMTCSQADADCPYIAGAEKRVPVTYEDPKAFDNTPHQKEKYRTRSLQIATEMFYVFSQINP